MERIDIIKNILKSQHHEDDIYKNYLEIYAINNHRIEDSLTGIKSIKSMHGDSNIFSELFNINDITDLVDYVALDAFVNLVYQETELALDCPFDEQIMIFVDRETDDIVAGIHAYWDYDEENDMVDVTYNLMAFGFEDESYEYCDSCEDCGIHFEFEDIENE